MSDATSNPNSSPAAEPPQISSSLPVTASTGTAPSGITAEAVQAKSPEAVQLPGQAGSQVQLGNQGNQSYQGAPSTPCPGDPLQALEMEVVPLLRPGHKTTEFYVLSGIIVLTLLESLLGQLPAPQATTTAAFVGVLYTVCRVGLKVLDAIHAAQSIQRQDQLAMEAKHPLMQAGQQQ